RHGAPLVAAERSCGRPPPPPMLLLKRFCNKVVATVARALLDAPGRRRECVAPAPHGVRGRKAAGHAGAAGGRTLTGRQPASLALVCTAAPAAHPAAQPVAPASRSADTHERRGRPPRSSAGGLPSFLRGGPFWDPTQPPSRTPQRKFLLRPC